MRNRLIELIKQGDKTFADKYTGKLMSHIDELYDFIADYLLENGVIVPTPKPDDFVYRCGEENVHEWQIVRIDVYPDEIVYIDDSDNEIFEDDIGKTVFLTREEAEQALKGGEG
jgi:hypothetical protein